MQDVKNQNVACVDAVNDDKPRMGSARHSLGGTDGKPEPSATYRRQQCKGLHIDIRQPTRYKPSI
jgi:hypothetical protein